LSPVADGLASFGLRSIAFRVMELTKGHDAWNTVFRNRMKSRKLMTNTEIVYWSSKSLVASM